MTSEQERKLAEVISGLMAETNRLRGEQRDVFLAKLTPDCAVTIRASGNFGVGEVDRLIRLLTVQRDILAVETPETAP